MVLQWKKKSKKDREKRLVKALISNYSPGDLLQNSFSSFAFAVGVVSRYESRKPGGTESITRKGIDVAIALDVSKSMLATDLQPNRLERAKQLITKLMNEMPNDRIALVLFAGKAYLQMPLTVDHGAAAMYVRRPPLMRYHNKEQ